MAACTAVHPPTRGLTHIETPTPEAREALRWLRLAEAELSDLLIIRGISGREHVVPNISNAGQQDAKARIQRLKLSAPSPTSSTLPDVLRRSVLHAQVLLERAEVLWGTQNPKQVQLGHPEVIDRVWMRARRALLATAPRKRSVELNKIEDFVVGVSNLVSIRTEGERAWAHERFLVHVEELEALTGTTTSQRFTNYERSLRETELSASPSIQLAMGQAVGSTTAPNIEELTQLARSKVEKHRRQLYELALEIAQPGPSEVDARVEVALPLARATRARTTTFLQAINSELARLESWLRTHRVLANLPPGSLQVKESLAHNYELYIGQQIDPWARLHLPDPTAIPGDDGLLAWLAKATVPHLLEYASRNERIFEADPTTIRALSTRILEELAAQPSEIATPATRLLVTAIVAERRARAAAEFELIVHGRKSGFRLLTELAWHDSAAAEDVLDAASAQPGRYAAIFWAERLLGKEPQCPGLTPAALCSK